MVNLDCKNDALPFGKECSKRWYVYDGDSKTWVIDESVSLECTHEGTFTYIKTFNNLNHLKVEHPPARYSSHF